jgi:hypothetical protein
VPRHRSGDDCFWGWSSGQVRPSALQRGQITFGVARRLGVVHFDVVVSAIAEVVAVAEPVPGARDQAGRCHHRIVAAVLAVLALTLPAI